MLFLFRDEALARRIPSASVQREWSGAVLNRQIQIPYTHLKNASALFTIQNFKSSATASGLPGARIKCAHACGDQKTAKRLTYFMALKMIQ
jgi:hypothetical protein